MYLKIGSLPNNTADQENLITEKTRPEHRRHFCMSSLRFVYEQEVGVLKGTVCHLYQEF